MRAIGEWREWNAVDVCDMGIGVSVGILTTGLASCLVYAAFAFVHYCASRP